MKVFVYYNLHKHCWSVKALEGPNKGRVIAHRDSVSLTGVTFKVSQKGRERVLREQKKNVHAGVVGYMGAVQPEPTNMGDFTEVTYNPYKYSSFVKKIDASCINHANTAFLQHKRVFVQ